VRPHEAIRPLRQVQVGFNRSAAPTEMTLHSALVRVMNVTSSGWHAVNVDDATPARVAATIPPRLRQRTLPADGIPNESQQRYLWAVDTQQVERRLLAAASSRDCSGLNDEGSVATNGIPLCRARCVTEMQMSRKKFGATQFHHRHSRTSEESSLVHTWRQVKRMMRHDDAHQSCGCGGEPVEDSLNPPR
jgi:hypothetical protein